MNISQTASQMAKDIVQAYAEHDEQNYQQASSYFARVFINLFQVDASTMRKASDSYTEALRQHDLIEDDENLSTEEKLEHKDWKKVWQSLSEFCEYLNISDEFAREAAEYFRLHGQRENQYVQHLYSADLAFTQAILGSNSKKPHAVHALLSGLYLGCVGAHDFHDEFGIEMMKNLIRIYYEFLLKNRESYES